MRQNSLRPHSAPFRRAHTKTELDDPIKGYKIFPDNKKPSADVCFIKHMVSLRSLVEDNMKELENNYLAHTFGLSSHIDRMRDYFDNDRLDLKSIDKQDVNCLLETIICRQQL